MNARKCAILVLLAILPTTSIDLARAAPSPASVQPAAPPVEEIRLLKRDIKNLTDDVAILRRDQVNYKLDKDLLKNTYASNLERIQLIITLVFGSVAAIVGLLGYIGIRSIKDIRNDYTRELSELNTLRNKLEAEISALSAKQKTVEERVVGLSKTNEEQDNRLKVLELTEKIAGLVQRDQYQWALQYTDPALALDPKNETLLSLTTKSLDKATHFSKFALYLRA